MGNKNINNVNKEHYNYLINLEIIRYLKLLLNVVIN